MVLWHLFVSKQYLLRLVDIVTKFCFVRELFARWAIITVNRHMASSYNLPPPEPLEIHGVNAAERWKKFKRAWNNYSIAIEVNTKSEHASTGSHATHRDRRGSLRKWFSQLLPGNPRGMKRRSLQYWISLVRILSAAKEYTF